MRAGDHGLVLELFYRLLASWVAEIGVAAGTARPGSLLGIPRQPRRPPPLPRRRPPAWRSKSEQINSDPNSALGSLPYTAPEVLSNTMRHGHQADVWSLGVALYKMCVGLYPFERLEDAADARTAVQVGRGSACARGRVGKGR